MPKGISTKADLHHPKPSRKTLLIIDKKRVDLSKKKRNTSIKGPESLLKDIKSRNHIGIKEKTSFLKSYFSGCFIKSNQVESDVKCGSLSVDGVIMTISIFAESI